MKVFEDTNVFEFVKLFHFPEEFGDVEELLQQISLLFVCVRSLLECSPLNERIKLVGPEFQISGMVVFEDIFQQRIIIYELLLLFLA